MTRAQRLDLLKQIEKDIHVCSLESTLLDDAKSCAIHSAIEELEQEPILDKVRAQIEDFFKGLEMSLAILEKGDKLEPNLKGAVDAVEECIKIIDEAKSKAEK